LAAVALDAELIIDWPVALDAEPLLRYGGTYDPPHVHAKSLIYCVSSISIHRLPQHLPQQQ
jgi:hypothetical protein